MRSYVIDRIEDGAWAVLEEEQGRTFDVPASWLPAEAREGDVVKVSGAGTAPASRVMRFELDPEAKARRLKAAEQRRDKLPRGPEGDLAL